MEFPTFFSSMGHSIEVIILTGLLYNRTSIDLNWGHVSCGFKSEPCFIYEIKSSTLHIQDDLFSGLRELLNCLREDFIKKSLSPDHRQEKC